MDVGEAVVRRRSIRQFLSDPVPGAVVRGLIEAAARAPSGGNLQPWRIHAVAGEPLERFRVLIKGKMAENPRGEPPEYAVYPKDLWEPHRSSRFAVGEAMYASLQIERENKLGRLMWFARNYEAFGAPVLLFVTVDRRMGPPQWSDLGMYLQTLMLLAVEQGLDTCAQEAWSVWPKTVGEFLGLPDEQMLFCGLALGRRDADAPVNSFPIDRLPFDAFAAMQGFDA